MRRSPAVVAYDIRENATRRRVFRVLKRLAHRGAKSVAECFLSRREAEELFVQLCEVGRRRHRSTGDCLVTAADPDTNIGRGT